MNTPNTPAELAAMANGESTSPYQDFRVIAAMEAISPSKGCSLAHVQALAEICISTLRDNYEQMSVRTKDDAEREYYNAMVTSLLGAEALVERSTFVNDYCGD